MHSNTGFRETMIAAYKSATKSAYDFILKKCHSLFFTEEKQPTGLLGRRHLDYLKRHRRVTYINLLTSGRLNSYLADIDKQAQKRFELLIEGMK